MGRVFPGLPAEKDATGRAIRAWARFDYPVRQSHMSREALKQSAVLGAGALQNCRRNDAAEHRVCQVLTFDCCNQAITLKCPAQRHDECNGDVTSTMPYNDEPWTGFRNGALDESASQCFCSTDLYLSWMAA
jgi:hypothetical protein